MEGRVCIRGGNEGKGVYEWHVEGCICEGVKGDDRDRMNGRKCASLNCHVCPSHICPSFFPSLGWTLSSIYPFTYARVLHSPRQLCTLLLAHLCAPLHVCTLPPSILSNALFIFLTYEPPIPCFHHLPPSLSLICTLVMHPSFMPFHMHSTQAPSILLLHIYICSFSLSPLIAEAFGIYAVAYVEALIK